MGYGTVILVCSKMQNQKKNLAPNGARVPLIIIKFPNFLVPDGARRQVGSEGVVVRVWGVKCR